MTVTNFTATVDGPPTGLVYHVSMHLAEISGKSGASITALNFSFGNGAMATATGTIHIPAGGGTDTGTINITDSAGRAAASQITVLIRFTDDTGKAGTANGSTTTA